MTYIDIHAHFDFKDFSSDREDIISEMKKKKIICYNNTLNRENYEYSKELFKDFSDTVKVCPGLYPQDAEKISEEEFEDYLKLIEEEKDSYLAIGEIGLDKKWTKDDKLFELQVLRFKKLIELGIKLDKPLIIHTRQAEVEVLDILEEYVNKYNYKKFVLHCFSGKKKLINKIKQLKLYCSIPLIVQNTQVFQILVEELPMSQILTETDSPFLNPDKTRNSPLNIYYVYEEIAKIKKYDKTEIENIIYRNYQKLFM